MLVNYTRKIMINCNKVADRLTDNPEDNNYLNCLPLHKSRLWFRYRARAIKGVKYNCKSSYPNLNCRFCDRQIIETQEHLETCEGNSFERRGLNNLADRDWKDTLKFWERMSIKLEKWKKNEDLKKKEEEKNKKAQVKKTNNVHSVSNVSNVAAVAIHNSLT